MRIVVWNRAEIAGQTPEELQVAVTTSLFQAADMKVDILLLRGEPVKGCNDQLDWRIQAGRLPQAQGEESRGYSDPSDWRVFEAGDTAGARTVVALRGSLYPNARLVGSAAHFVLLDPGDEHRFSLLALVEDLADSTGVEPVSSIPQLRPYLEQLSEAPVLLIGVRHETRAQIPLTDSIELHSTLRHLDLETRLANHPSFDDVFLPADWQLEEVAAKHDLQASLLLVDCEPSDHALPELERADDVEVVIVTESAITFRLQSPSRGWRHGADSALDLVVFEQALTSSGVYQLFVCACGISGCHCYPPRPRGVLVRLLADGDTVWHDRDRDLWYRFPLHRLRQQLRDLGSRGQVVMQEFSDESGTRFAIEPYRSARFLDLAPPDFWQFEFPDSLDEADEELEGRESSRAALAYFPELPNNALANEIREFTRWIDDERLEPLGTRFVPFAETLLEMFPQLLKLPSLERIVLVISGAAHHEDVVTLEGLFLGYPKIWALIGDLDAHLGPLLCVRTGAMPALRDLPQCAARLPFLAALLRFGELLCVAQHRPRLPMPRDLFGPFEELIETDDPDQPYLLQATPFDQAGLMEFWRRAYTDSCTRTESGELNVVFQVPTSVAELYTEKLVLPRVQELTALLDTIRQGFARNALSVGPLTYRVETCESVPRMPDSDEQLFGVEAPRSKERYADEGVLGKFDPRMNPLAEN